MSVQESLTNYSEPDSDEVSNDESEQTDNQPDNESESELPPRVDFIDYSELQDLREQGLRVETMREQGVRESVIEMHFGGDL